MVDTDVVIMGGGLAGLTAALQIKQSVPQCRIKVIERESFPVPEAAYKVGESTVEIAAHYFADVLGLRSHLVEHQLRKLGLRIFFADDENDAIERRIEIGSPKYFPSGTFQIDRGRFENYLAEHCREHGIEVIDGARVRSFEVASGKDAPHTVVVSRGNEEYTLAGRWLIDASGKAGMLKRQLGNDRESRHEPSSAWWRLGVKLNIDDWSDDPEWREGYEGEYSRWFSTNHLIGEGYWVWIIPLASGSTSIGIVADPSVHPLTEFNTFEKALQWLDIHEPQCGEKVREQAHTLQDFLARKHYSQRCAEVISADRWAITGDAGVFIDPFYSPGSDFIAITNTFIADLIAKDFSGERFGAYASVYNDLFLSFTENAFLTFLDQYRIFGNVTVMPAKVIWDFSLYWAFFAFVVFQKKLCDISTYVRIRNDLARLTKLNADMQSFFREWHVETAEESLRQANHRGRTFINLQATGKLLELNIGLKAQLSPEEFVKQLTTNIDYLCELGAEIRSFANGRPNEKVFGLEAAAQ